MRSVDEGLVSPSDIADLVGVTRGAVSNWRKRAHDFPEPVGGTSAKPLFACDAVLSWLKGRGHSVKTDRGETAVWTAMNSLRGEMAAEEAAELILALACLRKSRANGGDQWSEVTLASPSQLMKRVVHAMQRLDSEARCSLQLEHARLPAASETLAAMVAAVDKFDSENLGRTVDNFLERQARSQGKVGGEFGFVGSRPSSLLAAVAATRPAAVIYDPACGIAQALLSLIKSGARPKRLVGHDINGSALRIARQRAFLHGVDLELTQTDVLRTDSDPALKADTIIAEPPFGLKHDLSALLTDDRFEFGIPPRSSADTAWIQHIIAHLNDDGRGYVLTPGGSLFRGGNERHIRTELVRRGCVEAVVSLPGKMLPRTAIPLTLWVVRRPMPEAGTESILFIDGSEEEEVESRTAEWLVDRRKRTEVPHAEVSISDVLANESILTPQRWTNRKERDSKEIVRDFTDRWSALEGALERLKRAASNVQHFADVSSARVYSIGELIDQGILDLRTARPADRYDDLSEHLKDRIATASQVRDGTLHDTVIDLDDDIPGMTREGDVLVTIMHSICARVDATGGHLPSTGVHRLRILNSDVLTPYYLASTLSGTWNERFQVGSTIQRAAVRRLEIPLVPRDEQSKVQLAIGFLDQLHHATADLNRQIGGVRTTYLDAVYYNAPLKASEQEISGG